MSEAVLLNKYSQYGRLTSSGELYLSLKYSEMFIEDCNEMGIAIIGLEFFYEKNNKIIPKNPIEGIDCSVWLKELLIWEDIVLRCNKEISEIIKKKVSERDEVLFNPTIIDKFDWENLSNN